MDATESNAWFDEQFARAPLMAIFRGFGVERTLELARTAWEIGITVVEIPIQSARDLDALEATAELALASGRIVGAGTVVTSEHVRQAAARGASFTVSPGFDERITRESLDAGLAPLPGVATASEIQHAAALGLGWVKAFPASVLGTAWFGAMHGPFPAIKFAATGGISASNAREYLDAGASVVAVGSALEHPDQLPKLAAIVAA